MGFGVTYFLVVCSATGNVRSVYKVDSFLKFSESAGKVKSKILLLLVD